MYQLIDKDGKISSVDAKVFVIDKHGKIKQIVSGGTGSAVWGSITGTLTTQTDLTSYLSTNYYPLASNPAGYLTNASLSEYVPYTGATNNVDLGYNELTTAKLWLYDFVNGPTEKGSLHYADEALHFENSDGETLMYIEPGFMQLHKTGSIQSNFFTTLLTTNRDHYLPDASGTLALTSDIPSLTGYVQNTRTLTINGTTFDLTSNRSWSVGDLLSSGSYANPSWITSLAYSKLTGTPTIPTVGTWGALNYPSWTSGTPFVKMNAAGSFVLDTNTYLTSISGLNISLLTNDTGYITSSALSPYLTSVTAASTYFPIPVGTTSQYIRGNGSLATFPSIPSVGTWGTLNYPTWVSGTPFVKMTASGTFALDTNTYLTSITSSQITTALGYTPVTNARTLTINGVTFDLTADRTWTIPTVTPSALTKTDDTNVTLTLGGTPSTALLQAVSLTLGWTGTLADSRIASASTWNAKQNALGFTPYKFIATTQTAVTGSVSETIVATATINGNTFNSNDVMKILFRLTKAITTSNVSLRLRVNTINSLSGATQVGTYNFLLSNTQSLFLRTFDLNGGNLYGFNFNSSAQNDFTSAVVSPNSTAYNTANTLYFFFTVQLGTSTDSITPNLANITN